VFHPIHFPMNLGFLFSINASIPFLILFQLLLLSLFGHPLMNPLRVPLTMHQGN